MNMAMSLYGEAQVLLRQTSNWRASETLSREYKFKLDICMYIYYAPLPAALLRLIIA